MQPYLAPAMGLLPKKSAQASPKRSLARRIWRFCWKATAAFLAVTFVWVLLYRWVNPPVTYLQWRESCQCPEGSEYHKKWNDEVALTMKLAVVASEDNNFMKHNGIDWGAVEKARKYNETTGKKKGRMRGASTISQQTAKNVFLWPSRSYIRKGFEVYFTYLMEWLWPKERIMEVYLNVIETGPCKFGVEAAARDYFGVSASDLTADQAALIAASLPNPKKYIAGKPGKYLSKRKGQITRLMRLIGYDYFERYGGTVTDEQRKVREQEVEEKIRALPESELPEKMEEPEVLPVPAETQRVEISAPPDSLPPDTMRVTDPMQ